MGINNFLFQDSGISVVTRSGGGIHSIKVVYKRYESLANQLATIALEQGFSSTTVSYQSASALEFKLKSDGEISELLGIILDHFETLPSLFPPSEMSAARTTFQMENAAGSFKRWNSGEVAKLRAEGSFNDRLYDLLLDAKNPDEVRAIAYDVSIGENHGLHYPEIYKNPSIQTYFIRVRKFEAEQAEAAATSPSNFKAQNEQALSDLRTALEKEFNGRAPDERDHVIQQLSHAPSRPAAFRIIEDLIAIPAPAGGGGFPPYAGICGSKAMEAYKSTLRSMSTGAAAGMSMG